MNGTGQGKAESVQASKRPLKLITDSAPVVGNRIAESVLRRCATPTAADKDVYETLRWGGKARPQVRDLARIMHEFPGTYKDLVGSERACDVGFDYGDLEPSIFAKTQISVAQRLGSQILDQRHWPILFREFRSVIGDEIWSTYDLDGKNYEVEHLEDSSPTFDDFFQHDGRTAKIRMYADDPKTWYLRYLNSKHEITKGKAKVHDGNLRDEICDVTIRNVESSTCHFRAVEIKKATPGCEEAIQVIFRSDLGPNLAKDGTNWGDKSPTGGDYGAMLYTKSLFGGNDREFGHDCAGEVMIHVPYAVFRPADPTAYRIPTWPWTAKQMWFRDNVDVLRDIVHGDYLGRSLFPRPLNTPTLVTRGVSRRHDAPARDFEDAYMEMSNLPRRFIEQRKRKIDLESIFGLSFLNNPPKDLLSLLLES